MEEAKKHNLTLSMESVGLLIAAKAPRSRLLPALSELPS